MNENGDFDTEAGLTEPEPFSVIVTFLAPPPKVFPLIVKAVRPHVLPLRLLKVTVGGFEHCPNTFIEINKKTLTKRKALVIY